MPIFSTPATVLRQQRVDGEFIGRAFGVMTMISGMMMPSRYKLFGLWPMEFHRVDINSHRSV